MLQFFLQSLINHPSILTILWENEKNYYWRIRRWIGYYFKDIFNPRTIKLFTDYIQEQHDIKAKLSELSPFFSSLQNPKLYMYNSKHSPYFPFTFQAYILPHTLNCMCVSLLKFHIWISKQFQHYPNRPALPRQIKV